jgi:predicted RNase H-like HicB family nuclease
MSQIKIVTAVLSQGPDDFGCWLDEFEGIYGAGQTPAEALSNLNDAMIIYAEHNSDSPKWLKDGSYQIICKE